MATKRKGPASNFEPVAHNPAVRIRIQTAQGSKTEALANLNKARDWRKIQPEKPTRNFDWMDRLDFDALLAEATKLIDVESKPEMK